MAIITNIYITIIIVITSIMCSLLPPVSTSDCSRARNLPSSCKWLEGITAPYMLGCRMQQIQCVECVHNFGTTDGVMWLILFMESQKPTCYCAWQTRRAIGQWGPADLIAELGALDNSECLSPASASALFVTCHRHLCITP